MSDVGRNEPCPCGSGKKYKRCCLGGDETARAPSQAERLHRMDDDLVSHLGRYAAGRFGDEWQEILLHFAELMEEGAMPQIVVPFLVYEIKVQGRSVVSWFLEERGQYLDPEQRKLLEAQTRAWLSYWEILDVIPGSGFTARDMLTDETRTVAEIKASQQMRPRLVMLARLVETDGLCVCHGMYPRPLPPADAAALVTDVRKRLGATKLVTPARLHEDDIPEMLFDAWELAVDSMLNRPLPELRNSEGHEIVMVTLRWTYASPDARDRISELLRKQRDVIPPGVDDKTPSFALAKQGTNVKAGGSGAILGSVVLLAKSLKLETNSRERADELKQRMERLCAGLLKRPRREEVSTAEALARRPQRTRSAEATGPEVDAIVRDYKEQHYRGWGDESIPDLDNLTPREASKSPTHRSKLELLLKELEELEGRQPESRRFEVKKLRDRLGM